MPALDFNRIKENKGVVIIFSAIIALGMFLRVYHFSSWLHFEIDQSYDTLLVSPAVEKGLANLPLLGPTAGGGRALRLGPAYYYMEYLSAKIFGNTPPGHAALVLLLSIASLPLFYLFARKYFSAPLSLGLLAIFSFSIYSVEYSRFAWSPNVLPFFTLLLMYALLRCVSPAEKKKGIWFLAAAGSIAIITQIHFNAFFIFPAVAIIFLAIKRPRFKLKIWLAALAIIVLLYLPVIINEIKTRGEDMHFFVEKFQTQDTIAVEKKPNFLAKLWEDIDYTSMEYLLIVTGIDKVNVEEAGQLTHFTRSEAYQQDLLWRIVAIFLLAITFLLLILRLIKEKDRERKNFLLLALLWFFIAFLYFFALVYGRYFIFPRFFLIVSPLVFILLGLLLENLRPEKNRLRLAFFAAAVAFLTIINLRKINQAFAQLQDSQFVAARVETEDIFPDTNRVTLEQEQAIANYIISKYNLNKYPVYLKSNRAEYEDTFWYFLKRQGIQYYDVISQENLYQQGNYFVIDQAMPSSSFKSKLPDFKNAFDITEEKDFGTLKVYYLAPKPEFTTALRQNDSGRQEMLQAEQIDSVLTWKKLFSGETVNTNVKQDNLNDEIVPNDSDE